MGERVVAQGVAAPEDFGDEVRMRAGTVAAHEERRAGVGGVEEVEQARGVGGIGAVVDGEPDFGGVAGGNEACHDRREPLAVRRERAVEERQVRRGHRAERGKPGGG